MEFEELGLRHLSAVGKAVAESGRITCQLSAASLYCYAKKYATKVCVTDGAVFIRQERRGFGLCWFCPVAMPGVSLAESLAALYEHHQKKEKGPFIIWGVTDDILEDFNAAAKACGLTFAPSEPDRDWAEYIHSRENLIDMRGKRFHAKKNAVNQFMRNNSDYEYVPLSAENLEEARDFQKRLLAGMRKFEKDSRRLEALIAEDTAIDRGFESFERLSLAGGIIRIDGEISAYAFGSRINPEHFDLTFEKALRSYNGIFQVLEQEMLKNNVAEYKFINREEDLGEPGIRASKERLRPDILLMKSHFRVGQRL